MAYVLSTKAELLLSTKDGLRAISTEDDIVATKMAYVLSTEAELLLSTKDGLRAIY